MDQSSREAYVRRVNDWSIAALEAGLDSPSLRRLAALDVSDTWDEVERHLRGTAAELGFVYPSEDRCIDLQARFIAEDILSGRTSIEEGCQNLSWLYMKAGAPDRLAEWDRLYDESALVRQMGDGSLKDYEKLIREQAQRLLDDIAPAERLIPNSS